MTESRMNAEASCYSILTQAAVSYRYNHTLLVADRLRIVRHFARFCIAISANLLNFLKLQLFRNQ